MAKKEVDRAAIYRFLQELVDANPHLDGAETVFLLQDLIVNYCLFPNNGQQFAALSEIDQKIAQLMSNGEKIMAIKEARCALGIGLKEAKDYVEARTWPTGEAISNVAIDLQKKAAEEWMNRVAKDYNLKR
jgi:hypothetical protein